MDWNDDHLLNFGVNFINQVIQNEMGNYGRIIKNDNREGAIYERNNSFS